MVKPCLLINIEYVILLLQLKDHKPTILDYVMLRHLYTVFSNKSCEMEPKTPINDKLKQFQLILLY